MRDGIKASARFRVKFEEAKNAAIDAGICFYKARESYYVGDFGDYVATFDKQISERTVFRYINFIEEILEWAARAEPKLAGKFDKLIELGRKMAMQSPKGYTALCRSLKDPNSDENLLRANGEYNPAKYQREKLRESGRVYQQEFNFAATDKVLDIVEQHITLAIEIAPEDVIRLKERINQLLALLAEAEAKQGAVDVGEEEKI